MVQAKFSRNGDHCPAEIRKFLFACNGRQSRRNDRKAMNETAPTNAAKALRTTGSLKPKLNTDTPPSTVESRHIAGVSSEMRREGDSIRSVLLRERHFPSLAKRLHAATGDFQYNFCWRSLRINNGRDHVCRRNIRGDRRLELVLLLDVLRRDHNARTQRPCPAAALHAASIDGLPRVPKGRTSPA